jgi:nicotinamidase/pyrazinamidase
MNTVFFDIDTQLDFVNPSGALYVPGAERVLPAVGALNRYAAAQGIPVISTTDAHAEDDPEFAEWPPHCVAGTLGQHKSESTLLERRAAIPNREGFPEIEGAPQLILEKQTTDVFETLTVARLLDRLAADHAVVYGVVTEICVLFAARGLLRSGRKVTVVTDAIAALDAANSRRALEELRQAGCRLFTRDNLEIAAPVA